MKFYFNRTGANIFESIEARKEFYDDFFKGYDIDIENDKYLHFCERSSENMLLLDTRTVFFSKHRLIIFDAQIIITNKIPYGKYSVVIHKQSEVSSITVDCDSVYYSSTYQIKINVGSSIMEFDIQKNDDSVTDCVEALVLISRLTETE